MQIEWLESLAVDLRAALAVHGVTVSHGQALDLIAAVPGLRDWPEVMGPFFMSIWPGLEAYLMDILHAIMRVTKHVPEDHPFRGIVDILFAVPCFQSL